MALDVRQLRYFIAVAEEEQLTRAAQRLHMAQPALSQAIAQLERQLDVARLERLARGILLTPAGEAFLVEALEALEALGAFERAEAAARSWSQPRRRSEAISGRTPSSPFRSPEWPRHPEIASVAEGSSAPATAEQRSVAEAQASAEAR